MILMGITFIQYCRFFGNISIKSPNFKHCVGEMTVYSLTFFFLNSHYFAHNIVPTSVITASQVTSCFLTINISISVSYVASFMTSQLHVAIGGGINLL